MTTDTEELYIEEALTRMHHAEPDIDSEWQDFAATKSMPVHRRRRQLLSLVAAACVGAIIAFVGIRYVAPSIGGAPSAMADATSLWTTVHSDDGQRCQLTLPDGTRIWLSGNTEVRYPTSFSSRERTLELKGEAFFDVQKDSLHPFVVSTPYSITRVYGTQFNIRAYSADDCRVTLVTGSIEVTSRVSSAATGEPATVKLHPGEEASITADGALAVATTAEEGTQHMSWQDGAFVFDDVPLGDVLAELTLWYHAPVICHDQEVQRQKVHFTIDRNASLEEAVSLMNSLSVADIHLSEGNIIVGK